MSKRRIIWRPKKRGSRILGMHLAERLRDGTDVRRRVSLRIQYDGFTTERWCKWNLAGIGPKKERERTKQTTWKRLPEADWERERHWRGWMACDLRRSIVAIVAASFLRQWQLHVYPTKQRSSGRWKPNWKSVERRGWRRLVFFFAWLIFLLSCL